MKLKYNTQTNDIICMGAMPNLQAGANEAVVDVSFDVPSNLKHYTFDGTTLTQKSANDITKVDSENSFNVDVMTTRITEEIDDARELALLPYLGGIQSAAKAKNWAKLKALVNGLGVAQIATAQEVTDITAVIAEQGIVLGDY